MKASSTSALLTLVGVLAVFGPRRCMAQLGETVTNNPFASIAERNVFGLRPLPEPRHQEAPMAAVNIKISGFFRHANGPVHVLLASVPKNPKEQMKFYNMCQGEKEDDVAVVKIDPAEDAVDVVVDGVPEELTVKSNSFVAAAVEPPRKYIRR